MRSASIWTVFGLTTVATVSAIAIDMLNKVEKVVLKNRPAPLVVFTDLEPDDMVALRVLHSRGIQPKAVVVGEGNAETKAARMCVYANMLGWSKTRVFQGCSSDKHFPGDGADLASVDITRIPTAAPLFDSGNRGYETLKHLLEDNGEPLFTAENCRDAAWIRCLKNWIANSSLVRKFNNIMPPTLLVLKPPRELVNIYNDNDSGQSMQNVRNLFGNFRLAIYGSFNFREVHAWPTLLQWLNPGTTPFSQVLWYESFGGMQEGTKVFNRDTMWCYGGRGPEAVEAIPAYDECVRKVTEAWDAYMLKDCEDTCVQLQAQFPTTYTENSQWKRNRSCADAIGPYAGRQVVAADPVLAVIVADHVPYFDDSDVCKPVISVSIDPNDSNAYPVVTVDKEASDRILPTSKVLKFVNMEDSHVIWHLASVWKACFS